MSQSPFTTLLEWIAQTRHELVQPLAPRKQKRESFLPDFCKGDMVVSVLLIAQLFAVVIAMVTRRITFDLFTDLLLISLLIQWIALTSVGTLCVLRGLLGRLNQTQAIVVTYLLLLGITAIITELALWAWVLWLVAPQHNLHPDAFAYIRIQNFVISLIVNAIILRYLLGQHRLQRQAATEERSKLEAMQARIRPHFVFNSLNIIASLTRSAPDKAEEAIENMADLFRMMLNEGEQLVPLKKEIEVTHKYLEVEQLRLDERLKVEWDVGKFARRAVIPVLTLQPLLESAIRRGVEPSPTGGLITVRLWEENETINIEVVYTLPRRKSRHQGEDETRSLDDIRHRLEHYYDNKASLESSETDDRITIHVTLPLRGDTP